MILTFFNTINLAGLKLQFFFLQTVTSGGIFVGTQMVTELLGVTLPTQEYAGSTATWRNAPQMHLNQHPTLPLNPSLPLLKTMAKQRGVIFFDLLLKIL